MIAMPMPRQEADARALWALVGLALPISLTLAVGLGLGLMNWVGCRHLSPTLASVAATAALLVVGALVASLVANVRHARRSIRQAQVASVEVEDDERVRDVVELARAFDVAPPELRAVVLDTPVAFSVLGPQPAIVVSTWVFDRLTQAEWRALLGHELAHLRRGDRLVRWAGCWLLGAVKMVPGSRAAWRRLEAATEDVADQAAIEVLGDATALDTARAKFLAAQSAAQSGEGLARTLKPWTTSYQMAVAAIGLVAVLPLAPFVLVPLCAAVCAT